MIELRTMKYALAVAKYRNFRKAAETLFLTQPSLTKAIQNLEGTLGTKIFDRGKRKVEPTPLGRLFWPGRRKFCRALLIWSGKSTWPGVWK